MNDKLESLKINNNIHVANDHSDLTKILTKKVDIAILNTANNNLDLLKKINLAMPYIAIIDDKTEINETINITEKATQIGAFKCLSLQDLSNLEDTIKQAVQKHQINKNTELEAQMQIVSKSTAMQKTLKEIKQLKNAYVISIIGETGSGKKFISRHFAKKWNKEFKIIDCLDYDILQELNFLEHAIHDFQQKTNGQMFIVNHPEQLSSYQQNKLLNLIINAMGKNIQWTIIVNQKDEANLIRTLLERISVFKIYMPSIKERANDVKDIIKILEKQLSLILNKKIKRTDLEQIKNYKLPNNFKQLKTQIEHLFYQSQEKFVTKNIDLIIDDIFLGMSLKDATKLFEKIYFQRQMADKKAKLQQIAKIAQINRTTLYRKLNKL